MKLVKDITALTKAFLTISKVYTSLDTAEKQALSVESQSTAGAKPAVQ